MCRNQCCEVFVGISLFALMLAAAATPWYFTAESLPDGGDFGDNCAGVQLWGWNRLYFYESDDATVECKGFFFGLSQGGKDHINWRDQCDDGTGDCGKLRATMDGTLSMVLISLLCSFLSMCGSLAHCCTQYSYSAKGTVHKVITWIGFVTIVLAMIVFGARQPKSNEQLLNAMSGQALCGDGTPDGMCVPDKFWGEYHFMFPNGQNGDLIRIDSVYGPAGFLVGFIAACWYMIALCIAHRSEPKQPLAVQQHVTKIYSGYPQQAPQQQQPQYYAAQPVQVDNTMMPNNGNGNMYTGV